MMVEDAVASDEEQYKQQQLDYDRRIARAGAEKALELAEKRRKREEEEDAGEDIINPKAVKTVKSVVELFSAFQQMAKTPAQQAFDDLYAKNMANTLMNAGNSPPKRDLVDTILNSQLAFGFGSGLGNRGPELIESMGRTFGSQRAENMINGMMGKFGGNNQNPYQNPYQNIQQLPPGQPPTALAPGAGGAGTGAALTPEQQKNIQQRDLLMSLDPNNPEHVTAYSMTQGDIPIEVARKMLMIHQDAFVKQMKDQGLDTSAYQMRVPAGGVDDTFNPGVGAGGAGVDNIRQYRQPVVQPVVQPETVLDPPVPESEQSNPQQQNPGNPVPQEFMDYMKQMNDVITGMATSINSLQNEMKEMKQKQNSSSPKTQNIPTEQAPSEVTPAETQSVQTEPVENQNNNVETVEHISIDQTQNLEEDDIKKTERAMCYKCRKIKEVEEIKIGNETKRICASCRED